jgi:NADH-quinone oxidoreductase subunit N
MLLRIFVEALPAFSRGGLGEWFGNPLGWTTFFYVLSVVSMTVGNLAALTQSNMKRLLAYSSIAHAGYVLIGIVAFASGSTRGITATLIYLFIYAFMQLGAFAIVVMMRRADAIGDELKDLSGLYFRHPAAALAMLIFMLSLGGIPPTAGFMGKFWVFGAAIEAGYVWLAVIGVLNSAISLYYYIRVVVFMFIKEEAIGSTPVLSPALATVLLVAALGTLFFGMYPAPLFELAEASADTLGRAGAALTLVR